MDTEEQVSKELEEKSRKFAKASGLGGSDHALNIVASVLAAFAQQHTAEVERKLAVAVEALEKAEWRLKGIEQDKRWETVAVATRQDIREALSKIAGEEEN